MKATPLPSPVSVSIPTEGDLRVWWMPQIPSPNRFIVHVLTPHEARQVLDVLAMYDIYQFNNKIKPDYCNAGGLEVFQDGEWIDWTDDEGNDIDHWPLAIRTEIVTESF